MGFFCFFIFLGCFCSRIFLYTSFSFIICMFEDLFDDNFGQSEWSSVYLLLVLVIAALLLIAVVKPMFRQSQKIVAQTVPTAEAK